MRTRIEIPTSGTIDLYDDVGISLNYSIANIRDPQGRNASHSKTITVPGTKNNNDLFLNIFEIGSEGGFNPNIKTKAIVFVDTIPVMDGHLQLTDIIKTDKNTIEYELTIFGRLGNIFTIWGDDELRDIDFSSLNHTYNKTNVTASWTAPSSNGYYYPMIDYALTDGSYYKIEHFFPATYLRTYIDKIFTYAGYTYTSSFFTSQYFNNLIIPFVGTKLELTAQEISNRTFKAVTSAVQSISLPHGNSSTVNTTIQANTLTTSPVPASQYNTGTYYWTVNKTGNYDIYLDTIGYCNVQNATGGNITQAATTNQVQVQLEYSTNGGSTWTYLCGQTSPIAVNAQTFVAGTTVTVQAGINTNTSMTAYLGAGTILRARAGGYAYAMNTSLTVTFGLTAQFYNKPYADVSEGDTIDYNTVIPDKVKISDLFMSIVKCFNLYVEENKDRERDLIIEPREDFYTSGTTIDWTEKLDISRELDIKPMGALDVREFQYSYKPDDDFWNKKYTANSGKIFGERKVSTRNEFFTGNKKTEVIFTPSPMVAMPVGSTTSDRIVPQIIQIGSNGIPEPKTSGLKLLYKGGLRNTSESWLLRSLGVDYTYTTYPYAGHLDNPLDPTEDLNFGVPDTLYYTPNGYTNSNLYNKHYKKFIEEITDEESKIVVGYFYLTPLDILKLDFRNLYFVDGFYYRINLISDYNPIEQGLTKVELIKIKEGVPFVPSSGTVNTGAITFDIDETGAGLGWLQKKDESSYGQNAIVQGYRNYIDASAIKVIVNGDYNTVGGGSSNITLLGSSGVTVYPGLQNVTVLNSSGVTVTESNVTYIDGLVYNGAGLNIVNVSTTPYSITSSDGIILVNSSIGDITISAINMSVSQTVIIKKVSSDGNNVFIQGAGGINVDGSLTYTTAPNQYAVTTIYRVSTANIYVINNYTPGY